MKIGILTFHWATNYGAVLQTYALQQYLVGNGHDVEIINYKPKKYDDTIYTFFRYRKFVNFKQYLKNRKKEESLVEFRHNHLHLTERVYFCRDMQPLASRFDIIISGSDQVVNPSFLLNGEGRGVVSPTYFLAFPFNGKRIGYALSFGCVVYPKAELEIAKPFIKDFDIISVREETGVEIVKSMGRDDAIVVPDPTMLMSPSFYNQLAGEDPVINEKLYIYSFFIRNIAQRKTVINEILKKTKIIWNNDDCNYSINGWLNKILNAQFVITDSFHCVAMCLKLHKPFAVITEHEGNVGMNDRLHTMLKLVGLENHIIHKNRLSDIISIQNEDIDWHYIDEQIAKKNNVVTSVLG